MESDLYNEVCDILFAAIVDYCKEFDKSADDVDEYFDEIFSDLRGLDREGLMEKLGRTEEEHEEVRRISSLDELE